MLLENTPAQAESLLSNLEQAAEVIGLHCKANKSSFVLNKKEQATKISLVHMLRQQYLIY